MITDCCIMNEFESYVQKEKRAKKLLLLLKCFISTLIIMIFILVIIYIVQSTQNNTTTTHEGFRMIPAVKEICFDPENQTTFMEYVNILNTFIQPYEKSRKNVIDCSTQVPKGNEVCEFRTSWLNRCQKKTFWGFKSSSPCIILTLDKNMTFIPMPYSSKLPNEMPQEFKDLIMEEEEDDGLMRKEIVRVYCTNATTFNPLSGFFKNSITFNNETKNEDFLSPLVAVQFNLHDIDNLDIECTLWSNTKIINPFPKFQFKIRKYCE